MITIDVYLLESMMWDVMLGAVAAYIGIAFVAFVIEHIPFLS